MHQRKGSKVLIYFFLLCLFGSINNINFSKLKINNTIDIKVLGLGNSDDLVLLENFKKLNLDNIFFINDEQIKNLIDSNSLVENYKIYAHWVNAVGFAIIENIELKIGSETIDSHTGLWYDIWNELTDPNKKEWGLVGKYDKSKIGYVSQTDSFYVVPLKFYFNRNPGLALPVAIWFRK